MADDIVTRLRGKEHGDNDERCEACDSFCCHCELCDCCIDILEVCLVAADEIERLRSKYALAYWNLRQVLEVAHGGLVSPHPLWGFLNECAEDIDRMEKTLNITNKMEPF